MPVFSATNGDTRSIFAGCAIAGKGNRWIYDRVVLAGNGIVATAIALDGALPEGIIRGDSVGVLSLDDWGLPAGSKYLVPNAIYTLGAGGTLVANGTGQPIGIAASKTDLTLTIGTGIGQSVLDQQDENTSEIADLVVALQKERDERIAKDDYLQTQITELFQPVYARHMLLGGI